MWPYMVAAAVAAYGGWKYYTRHNYPDSVANILRKGLMAEINGAGFRKSDLKLALKYYLEALQEADRIRMWPLSDEYTGIQLRIADVYERMGLNQEALLMYMELANVYLTALATKQIPEDQQAEIIQRDLRMALMVGLYMSGSPVVARMTLLPHIILAQNKAARKNPQLAAVLKEPLSRDFIDEFKKGHTISKKFEDAWGPFRDELFALREMYLGLCVGTGELSQALEFKIHTTEWMLYSGFSIGESLLSIVNMASIAYLYGASEAVKRTTEKALSMARNKNPNALDDSALQRGTAGKTFDSSKGVSTQMSKSESSLFPEFNSLGIDSVGLVERPTYHSNKKTLVPKAANPKGSTTVAVRVKDESNLEKISWLQEPYEFAANCYKDVLEIIEKLPGRNRREALVPEAYAMAVYGLGVLEIQRGNYEKALGHLREARVRAKGCRVEELIDSSNKELLKIEKLIEQGKTSGTLDDVELPALAVLFWRQEPENWAEQNSHP